jgi:hypothetical protein
MPRVCHGRTFLSFSQVLPVRAYRLFCVIYEISWGLVRAMIVLFLLCSYCKTPRRHVYGWEWDSFSGWSNRVRSISWRCRSCARLRYSSEGGYLRPTGFGRLGRVGLMLAAYGKLPRPEAWRPYVFTSIDDPSLEGLLRQSCTRPASLITENAGKSSRNMRNQMDA